MDLVTSILAISIAIVLYIYTIEVFTILFRITGLTKEKAKFQVISLITCSGYTTSEAEIVTTNNFENENIDEKNSNSVNNESIQDTENINEESNKIENDENIISNNETITDTSTDEVENSAVGE